MNKEHEEKLDFFDSLREGQLMKNAKSKNMKKKHFRWYHRI